MMDKLIGQLPDGTLYVTPSAEYESMGAGAVTTNLMLPDIMRKLFNYEKMGTPEELRALKEKAKPRMVIAPLSFGSIGSCIACSASQVNKRNYCYHCGQRLDWEGKDDHT